MGSDEHDDAAVVAPVGRTGRLLRHSAFNLGGVLLPALAAIAAIPLLIAALGAANFGIFSIQLALLVLLGINDFGVSRAVVLVAVDQGGVATTERRVAVVSAGLTLIGVIALALVAIGMPLTLVGAALNEPERADNLLSWGLIALSSAISLPTLPLRAGMEVEERFGQVNLLRAGSASLLFLAPLLAVQFAPTLAAAAAGLLFSRILVLAAFALATDRQVMRGLRAAARDLISHFRERRLPPLQAELVRRGGWLGAAGTASIVLSYVDRFALGLLVSATIVAEYVVAAELATKLWLVVGAVIAAATPRLAGGWKEPDGPGFRHDLAVVTASVLLVAAVTHGLFLFAGERLLQLWLGDQFRHGMTELLRILSLGIAINSLSNVNNLLLVIAGRERAAALVQFVSLPLMAVAALIAARWSGAVGVAWVFTARLVLDSLWIKFLLARGQTGLRAGVPYWLTIGWAAAMMALYLIS